MQTIIFKKTPRPNAARHRPARTVILSIVLGAILFPGGLPAAIPAMDALPDNPYVAVMNWNPSPDAAVSGYQVYYGTTSGNYSSSVLAGNVTGFTVEGLEAGVTYFFAVTACYPDGSESSFSEEVSFVPGQPSVRLNVTPDHQMVLNVAGLVGQTYEIQATQDFETWDVIGTVTTDTAGQADFIDPDAFLLTTRFYRIRATP